MPPPDSRASPSVATAARELPLRDVRDLALAVIEGAVAAESLAKELRRTPDRSQHFQEIADRLRAVVGRASIRNALTHETAPPSVATTSVTMTTPPQLVGLPPVPPPARPAPPPPAHSTHEIRVDSGAHDIGEIVDGAPQLDRIEMQLRELSTAEPAHTRELGALAERLARLEDLMQKIASKSDGGERYALRSPEEAIALAARLTERLRREPRVMVRIEPG